jgi:hypothetical protein
MKRKLVKMTALGLTIGAGVGLMPGCGSGENNAAQNSSPAPTAQSLDTAAVLKLAQTGSEVTEPFAVNAGALTLTDTSETSDPISVNGS